MANIVQRMDASLAGAPGGQDALGGLPCTTWQLVLHILPVTLQEMGDSAHNKSSRIGTLTDK